MRIGKRRISKKLLLLVVVPVVLVFAGTGAVFAAAEFTDIAGNTHEQSIINMADRGVTEGYPDGTFRPDNPVTRGQMMTFLDRYMSGIGCTDCHNEGTELTGRETAWEESGHGTGTAYARGTSASCAGCHSGGGFMAMVAAGQTPDQVTSGDPIPTRQDCRACHDLHTSYTGADWALRTTSAVPLYAVAGSTYDGGEGNLCANCHQPRRDFASQVEDGMVEVDSTHWGPHHGPQAAMLLGVAGAGATGAPMSHYNLVSDTCVTCHLGEVATHSFEPSTDACTSCHGEVDDFDIGDTQTEVQAMLDELQEALEGAGLLDEEGEPVVGTYTEAQAGALWNYIFIAIEDSSLGVHNPTYTKALLEASLEAF